MMENRPRIKDENPKAKGTELTKLGGKEWRKMSENSKKKYVEKATEDKDRYKTEMESYKPPSSRSSSRSSRSKSSSRSD